jgi:hypothetical protein
VHFFLCIAYVGHIFFLRHERRTAVLAEIEQQVHVINATVPSASSANTSQQPSTSSTHDIPARQTQLALQASQQAAEEAIVFNRRTANTTRQQAMRAAKDEAAKHQQLADNAA